LSAYCICKSYDFSSDAYEVFNLFKDEPFVFFLDSSLNETIRGRYSFIGFDPFKIFREKDKNSLCDLRNLFNKFSDLPSQSITPLVAGMVGFFSYDFGFQFENIKLNSIDDLNLPDCLFGLYDCIITIDHLLNKLHITSTGLPEKRSFLAEKRADDRLKFITEKLSNINLKENKTNYADDFFLMPDELTADCLISNFSKDEYIEAINKALRYISEGDIYQVNLSQRFLFDTKNYAERPDPVDIYSLLRKISPSSFSGYFDCKDFQIISSSPERFLKVKDNIIETRPMKGTRQRGRNRLENEKFRNQLLKSKKDKAELLMITDLLRNDLGRVSRYGSVKVREM